MTTPNLLAAHYLSKLMLQIFEPSHYRNVETTDPAILPLGRRELTTLLAHFGAPKKNRDGTVFQPLVSSDACEQEFLTFKRSAVRCRDACGQGGPASMLQELFGGSSTLQMLIPGDLCSLLCYYVNACILFQFLLLCFFRSTHT